MILLLHLFPYTFPFLSLPPLPPLLLSSHPPLFTSTGWPYLPNTFLLPFFSPLSSHSCIVSSYLNASTHSESPSKALPAYCANPSSSLTLPLCLSSHIPSRYTAPSLSFPHYPLPFPPPFPTIHSPSSIHLPFPPLLHPLPPPFPTIPSPSSISPSPLSSPLFPPPTSPSHSVPHLSFPLFPPRLSHFLLALGPLLICESLRLH